jgi:putative spermidine/putrescine transport system permease protein
MHRRGPAFWLLTGFFALFVLFLYGPTITITILSFQGPSGGLTFPMRGVSLHWFGNLFEKQMVGDFAGSFQRSIVLGRRRWWSPCWSPSRRGSPSASASRAPR